MGEPKILKKRIVQILTVLVLLLVVSYSLSRIVGNNAVAAEPGGNDIEKSVETDVPHRSFQIITRQPETPVVYTGEVDASGEEQSVSCRTCHDTQASDPLRRNPGSLDQFHQGLTFQHGSLACLSCHNSKNYDTLALANDEAITYQNTMQLCAQCHGPQFRDYSHGSHGGMSGFWDLTRGNRTRNHCIDCHDPHSPAYPQVLPVFAPKPAGRH